MVYEIVAITVNLKAYNAHCSFLFAHMLFPYHVKIIKLV